MITIRPSSERGHLDHGWLDTYHTFSFGEYVDPRHMGFRALRVINEDRVAPGQGFGEHPHRDMEILTYVLAGELQHRDSLGTGAIIRPGQVQYMAAGTGILHSEFNPSRDTPVHLIQIWIKPARRGAPPRYEQRDFPSLQEGSAGQGRAALTLLASADGRDGSIAINQDAAVYAAALQRGQLVRHELADGRGAWLQVLRGSISVAGHTLNAGDGAAVTEESAIELRADADAEVLLFDLGA